METLISTKKVLVYDYGSYVSICERLARQPNGFAKVYYYMPYVYNGYPDHKPEDIGRGIPNVIRIREWSEVIHEVDIVVFPDAHEPALQEYFVSIGKKVYGSRYASDLEHDRYRLKMLMDALALPSGDWNLSIGVDELERYLKDKENVWVKSKLRGDMETFKHQNWLLSRNEFQRMRTQLGASQNRQFYITEEDIESIGEIGIDTECVDGRYPLESLAGIELKDTGFYGKIVPYRNLPKQLTDVTDKLSDTFRSLNYRGAYSNEVIISKNLKGYLLDNTCRMPQPPTDLKMEMYSNFPEVIWQVANGIVPKIEYEYQYGVQFIIKSEIAKTDASPIIIPEEYKQFVKIKNQTVDEYGMIFYTPLGIEMKEIGSVVFFADSIREAVKGATKIAESIKGLDIEINTDCISKAQEQLDKLRKAGINYLT